MVQTEAIQKVPRLAADAADRVPPFVCEGKHSRLHPQVCVLCDGRRARSSTKSSAVSVFSMLLRVCVQLVSPLSINNRPVFTGLQTWTKQTRLTSSPNIRD